jgi:hypothetical protein
MPPVKRRNYQTARMMTGGPAPKRQSSTQCGRRYPYEDQPSSASEEEAENMSTIGSLPPDQDENIGVEAEDHNETDNSASEGEDEASVDEDHVSDGQSTVVDYQLPDWFPEFDDDEDRCIEHRLPDPFPDFGSADGARSLFNEDSNASVDEFALSDNDEQLYGDNGELELPPYDPYVRRAWPMRDSFPPGWQHRRTWAPLSWPDFTVGWRGRSYPSIPDLHLSEDSIRYLETELNGGVWENITLGSFSYHWWTINRATRGARVNSAFNFLLGNLDMWGKPPVDKYTKN